MLSPTDVLPWPVAPSSFLQSCAMFSYALHGVAIGARVCAKWVMSVGAVCGCMCAIHVGCGFMCGSCRWVRVYNTRHSWLSPQEVQALSDWHELACLHSMHRVAAPHTHKPSLQHLWLYHTCKRNQARMGCWTSTANTTSASNRTHASNELGFCIPANRKHANANISWAGKQHQGYNGNQARHAWLHFWR